MLAWALILAVPVGAFIVSVLLPIASFLVLDGIVAFVRGKGVKPLLVGILLPLGIGALGLVMWQGGLSLMEGSPAFEVTRLGAAANMQTLTGWAFILGVIAFVGRMLVLLVRGRSRR